MSYFRDLLPDDGSRMDHNVLLKNHAMIMAIVSRDVPVLSKCLREGAEPNVPILKGGPITSTNLFGSTPLMPACICAPNEKNGVPTCADVLLAHAEVDIYAKWEPPDYPGMDSITAMGIAYGATKFRPKTRYLRTALVDRAVHLAVVAEFQIDKVALETHLLDGSDPAPQGRALNLSIKNNAMLQAITGEQVDILSSCLQEGADPNATGDATPWLTDFPAAPALIVAFIRVPRECEEVTVADILLTNVRLNLYVSWTPPPGMYTGEEGPITAMVLAVGGRRRHTHKGPLYGIDSHLVAALLRSAVHYAGITDSSGGIECEINDGLERGKLQNTINSNSVLYLLITRLLPQAFRETNSSWMSALPVRPRTNRFKV